VVRLPLKDNLITMTVADGVGWHAQFDEAVRVEVKSKDKY